VRYFADCVAEPKKAVQRQVPAGDEELVQVGNDGPFGRTI
jgi:hypothetical protein